MRPALLRLGLAGLIGALTDLCGLALLATATWLITRAAQQPPITALSVAIVSVRAFAIGKGSLRYVERLVGHDAALRVLADLRTRIFAGLSRDPAATPSGDALSRLVSDVDGVQDALLRCALPAGVAVVISIATIGFTAIFAPAAALVVAVALLVAGGLLPLAGYLGARRYASRLAPVRGGYLSASLDVVHGAGDLAAYGATGQALGRADDQARALAGNERRAGRVGSLVAALGVPVPGIAAIVVLAIVVHGAVNPVMVSVLALLALAAVEAVLPLGGAAVRYAELRPALARVRELLAEHPEPAGNADRDGHPDRLTRPSAGAPTDQPESTGAGPVGIRLVGVGLRYSKDRVPALRDIDLELPAGRRVAVVGPSGSGKSSLLRLIAGVAAPTEGRLTIEGASEDPGLRYRIVGGVLADAHVFHANLRENLTLGRPGFTDVDLLDALATAGYPSTAETLNRVVGEDGATVSGGQRQRLLLARALLGAPDVLLMDEPTEGLDPAAADDVLAAVLRAAGQRSVVLVTHRLVDLAAFDEVIVLVDGSVSQRGRDEVLRGQPGWYQRWQAAAALTEPGYVAASAPA